MESLRYAYLIGTVMVFSTFPVIPTQSQDLSMAGAAEPQDLNSATADQLNHRRASVAPMRTRSLKKALQEEGRSASGEVVPQATYERSRTR
jgi:hypothetical protein